MHWIQNHISFSHLSLLVLLIEYQMLWMRGTWVNLRAVAKAMGFKSPWPSPPFCVPWYSGTGLPTAASQQNVMPPFRWATRPPSNCACIYFPRTKCTGIPIGWPEVKKKWMQHRFKSGWPIWCVPHSRDCLFVATRLVDQKHGPHAHMGAKPRIDFFFLTQQQ